MQLEVALFLLATISVAIKYFGVKNYGAAGDEKTDESPAIRKAFNPAEIYSENAY